MSFIDKTYFVHEINIPDSDYSGLTAYITRYEKEVLQKLLGYELWKALDDDLVDGEPQTQRFIDLVDGKDYTLSSGETIRWNGLRNDDKVSLIAYYTFYWYLRNKTTATSTLGEIRPNVENSANASPAQRLSGAWHRLEELYGYYSQTSLIGSAYNFLKEHESSYDEWVFTAIGSVNSFDL